MRNTRRDFTFIAALFIFMTLFVLSSAGCPGAQNGDETENGDSDAAIVQDDADTPEIRESQAEEEIVQPDDSAPEIIGDAESTDEDEVADDTDEESTEDTDEEPTEDTDHEAAEDTDHETADNTADEDEEGDEEDREGEDDEEFEPTQEQPLAPPAQEAVGVNEVGPDQISVVVSASGTGDPVPLEDDTTIVVGDSLNVQISIVNTMEDSVTINFPTSQKLDLAITDEEGDVNYRWSDGKRFAQVVNELELTSGEVWSHELTIPIGEGPGMVPPGSYTVGVFVTGEPPLGSFARNITLVK